MDQSTKYNRTLHAQISLGTTSDDRILPDGYVKVFAQMPDLIMTEKLDGQNNCLSKNGVFARSHAAPSELPWDRPLRERWELIKGDLNNLEVFGENMYGVHSIGYQKLESFFYVFAIREGKMWLSWEEVEFYAAMLDFPTVPQLPLMVKLKDFYHSNISENELLSLWLTENLGMKWLDYVETPGQLGSYETQSGKDACEGLVIRNAAGFMANDGEIPVAANEFNNLMKVVRPSHVKTDQHWTKNWKAATLIDYRKYNWNSYEFNPKK